MTQYLLGGGSPSLLRVGTKVLICRKSMWPGSIDCRKEVWGVCLTSWLGVSECNVLLFHSGFPTVPCAMPDRIPLPVDQVFRVALLVAAPGDSANHYSCLGSYWSLDLRRELIGHGKWMPAWSQRWGSLHLPFTAVSRTVSGNWGLIVSCSWLIGVIRGSFWARYYCSGAVSTLGSAQGSALFLG